MSYFVICPSCGERNFGVAFECIKCHTNLIGIPRQDDSLSEYEASLRPTTTVNGKASSSEDKKYSIIESVAHALWRTLQGSLVIFLIALLFSALICWLFNMHSLYDFGNALFYAGIVLVFIGWYIFNGNERLVRSQTDPLNPMNSAMPGTHSERTRQYWLDYMEGTTSVSVIGFSAVLCFGLGWLIVSLVN